MFRHLSALAIAMIFATGALAAHVPCPGAFDTDHVKASEEKVARSGRGGGQSDGGGGGG